MTENIINHIVLVLDSSSSMQHVSRELVKVADNQIAYLAQRSKDLDQETRITVYSFADRPQCLIYDKDVLRMPSISQLYHVGGMTALVDASMLALNDLEMTPEKYGEHSFLIYVLTDGQENRSRQYTPRQLALKIDDLPDHWTVATFVPSPVAVHEAKRFGFPAQNIAVWDATTAAGVNEAGEKIRQTTDNFMTGRTRGVRGSKSLFRLETPSLSKVDAALTPLSRNEFTLYEVGSAGRIDDFVESRTGRDYKRGEAYYQLSKREEVQPQKKVAIVGTNGVYVGDAARQLLGLPDDYVKVDPSGSPEYDIFIQSTSDNRKLVPNTRLLLIPAGV